MAIRAVALLAAALLLQTKGATAGELSCGADVAALGGYLRTAQFRGTVVGAPVAGQRLFFHLDYAVSGASDPLSATLAAFLDGEPLCGPSPIDFELGFGRAAVCPEGWRATEGMHTLRWEIDPDRTLPETDENNNVAELVFEVGSRAAVDIDARRTYLRTGFFEGAEVRQPTPGQVVYLHLDYRVTGTQQPLAADVVAFADNQPLCFGVVELETGSVTTLACPQPWEASAGAHVIGAVVDQPNALPEASEDNNFSIVELAVRAPTDIDFEVLRALLRATPFGEEVASPVCGEAVYLHFDLRLNGTTASVTPRFNVLIDGRPQCFGLIQLNGEIDSSFHCVGPWMASPGRHTLRVELDPMNDIRETDERNNAVELEFDVTGAGTCAGDCDGDGMVRIAELITAVNIALGQQPLSDCPSLDVDGDGQVSIGELIQAVSNALNGCLP